MAKKIHVKETELPAVLAPTHTQALELRDLRLLKSSTFLEGSIVGIKSLPPQVSQNINVHCGIVPAEASLVYMITFSLKARSESGQEVMSIEAMFGLVFKFESLEGIDDTAGQAFGQTTGLFCIWPYWREFVHSSAARMGLPPIRIPLMRPTDLEFTSPAAAKPTPEPAEKRTASRKRRK